MSLFGTILSKIFPSHHPAVANANAATPGAQGAGTSGSANAQSSGGGSGSATSASTTSGAQAGAQTGGQAGGASAPQVDVEQVLTDMASRNGQKLNWRQSIVDLMKLLDMDSSLTARKELAHELGYTGDTNDSASMNIWLHKQVMRKLAENGGKVPADLRS